MRAAGFVAISLALGLNPLDAQNAEQPPAAARVAVTMFTPARGTFAPGDTTTSTLTIRNLDESAGSFWIGYSVQDPEGRWFDVGSREVKLGSRVESSPVSREWIVPADARSGTYRIVAAVWSSPPEQPGAVRLASVEQPSAFTVRRGTGSFTSFPSSRWHPGDHRLGRGRVDPDRVELADNRVRLSVSSAGCVGSEIRSNDRVHYGSYAISMRSADVPGTITAFFLYEDVAEGNDEIDIEIVYADKPELLLATWVGGQLTRQERITLTFDPRTEFHEYRIDYAPDAVSFAVDGVVLKRWTSGLPRRPMRLIANAWWPRWLSCPERRVDGHADIDWIRY